MKKTLISAILSAAALLLAVVFPVSFADGDITLMTGEEPPLFMAAGDFDPACRLNVVEALDIIMPEQSSDYTTAYFVEVIGYSGRFTLMIYSPSGGRAYIQDGIYWNEINTGQDEDYMTIEIDSGTMIAYSSGRPLRNVYVIIGVAAVLIIAAGGSALLVYGTGGRVERIRRRLRNGENGSK